jgi:hypothetical protein
MKRGITYFENDKVFCTVVKFNTAAAKVGRGAREWRVFAA